MSVANLANASDSMSLLSSCRTVIFQLLLALPPLYRWRTAGNEIPEEGGKVKTKKQTFNRVQGFSPRSQSRPSRYSAPTWCGGPGSSRRCRNPSPRYNHPRGCRHQQSGHFDVLLQTLDLLIVASDKVGGSKN